MEHYLLQITEKLGEVMRLCGC